MFPEVQGGAPLDFWMFGLDPLDPQAIGSKGIQPTNNLNIDAKLRPLMVEHVIHVYIYTHCTHI
jgi:hypothetical protein